MKKIIPIIIVIVFFNLFSCDEDNNSDLPDNNNGAVTDTTATDTSTTITSTTVAEDKQNISNTFNNTTQCIQDMRDGEFSQTFFRFLNIEENVILSEYWIEDLVASLEDTFSNDLLDSDDRFHYSNFTGTYIWNVNSKSWSKSSGSQIVLKFPAEETSLTNNCEFIFSKYSDGAFLVNNEVVYLPTEIVAELNKDDSRIMKLSAAVNYSTNGFPVPELSVIELFLEPATLKWNLERLTETQFESTIGFDNNDCLMELYGKISFENNDFENMQFEDINNLRFNLTKDSLKIDGSWDISTFSSLRNPSADELNHVINSTVNFGSQKIGDLRFEMIGENPELFIYYKDETSENTSLYYKPFISDFEALFSKYFGYNFLSK